MTRKFKSVLTIEECAEIEHAMVTAKNLNPENNSYHTKTWGYYDLPQTLKYIDRILSFASQEYPNKVKFANTYTRIYTKGSGLKIHTDRKGLDITVSLCVKKGSYGPWPLHVSMEKHTGPWKNDIDLTKYTNDYLSADLDVGDMVATEGTLSPHWRDPLDCADEQTSIYSFFHWTYINDE